MNVKHKSEIYLAELVGQQQNNGIKNISIDFNNFKKEKTEKAEPETTYDISYDGSFNFRQHETINLHIKNLNTNSLTISLCNLGFLMLENCVIKLLDFQFFNAAEILFDKCEIYSISCVSIGFERLYCHNTKCVAISNLQKKGFAEFRNDIDAIDTMELSGDMKNTQILIALPHNANTINKLSINDLNDLQININHHIRFSEIKLFGSVTNISKWVFEGKSFKSLEFLDFSTDGKIIFRNIEIQEKNGALSVISSHLENVEFYSCKLETNNFIFADSNLTGCSSFETKWPQKIKIHNSNIGNGKHIATSNSYFRYLKLIHEQSGDIAVSALYRRLELESLLNSKIPFYDKLAISLGKIFSLHGTAWYVPLGWIIFLNLILSATMFFISSDQFTYSVIDNIYNGMMLLNPANELDTYTFIVGEAKEAPKSIYLIDFIMRIVNSYLIFQFIRCLRKFYK